MRKYEKYKESGVEWIGKVPEGWDVRRLKDAYSSTNAGEVIDKGFWNTGNELLYTCQRTPMASDFSTFPKSKRTTKHDLLLTRNATPYIFVPLENAIYSNVVQRIVMHNKFDKRFVKRALECGVNAEQVNGDTIPSWNMQVWNNISFAFPSLSEQEKICNYLDEKTNNIDKRIELLQHKSEKYKTLRKNLISHVVTHGLNSDVKMKDTGIEWLGEIPENWEITRIKENYYIKGRIGWQGLKANEFIDEGPYLITGTDFIDGKVNWETCYHISKQRYMEAPEIHVRPGDLLITKDGTVGKLAYIDKIPGETSLNSHLLLLRPIKKYIYNLFLYRLLSSKVFDSYFQIMRNGSIMDSLSQRTISAFIYALPPLNEQKEIANYLDDKTSKIDKILTKIDEEIEKLKELRKVLINDAVTGKIKVI